LRSLLPVCLDPDRPAPEQARLREHPLVSPAQERLRDDRLGRGLADPVRHALRMAYRGEMHALRAASGDLPRLRPGRVRALRGSRRESAAAHGGGPGALPREEEEETEAGLTRGARLAARRRPRLCPYSRV